MAQSQFNDGDQLSVVQGVVNDNATDAESRLTTLEALDSLPRSAEINSTPTGAYTIVAGDAGKVVVIDAGLTIPTGLATGFQCTVILNNATKQTLTTAGNTVKGKNIAASISGDGFITFLVTGTNTIWITGDMEA